MNEDSGRVTPQLSSSRLPINRASAADLFIAFRYNTVAFRSHALLLFYCSHLIDNGCALWLVCDIAAALHGRGRPKRAQKRFSSVNGPEGAPKTIVSCPSKGTVLTFGEQSRSIDAEFIVHFYTLYVSRLFFHCHYFYVRGEKV